VKIRYPDFETTSRQTTVSYTSADDEIIPVVKDLFQKLYKLNAEDKKGMKQEMIKISSKWSPYRTYACRYLWG
jgi:3-methyladenine DNA glycosylase/8-oxoguanine DNA glycosylase